MQLSRLSTCTNMNRYGKQRLTKCLTCYCKGWTDIDSTRAAIKLDSDYQALYTAGLPSIREQISELTKAFSFWPSPDQREGGNVYDIR